MNEKLTERISIEGDSDSLNKSNLQSNIKPEVSFSASMSMECWSGPTPPPEVIAKFDQMVPGSAEKYIDAPLKEAEHRRKLEEMDLRADIRSKYIGQMFGFMIALGILIVSIFCVYMKQPLAGFGALFIGAASFAGIFLYLKPKEGKEENSSDES